MDFEKLTKAKLITLAKAAEIPNYTNLSKSRLIQALEIKEQGLEIETEEKITTMADEKDTETTESKVIENTKEVVKKEKSKELKPLSQQAKGWKTKLQQMNVTAVDFLIRYPDHSSKIFIEELTTHEKKI